MYNDYYVDSSFSTANDGVAAAITAIFATLGVFLLILGVISIVVLIAYWKILKKGGRPGWASLIPIYNVYELCKMIGVNPLWILIVFLSGFLNIVPVIGSLVSFAAVIYFQVLLNVSLARSFNKSDGYAVGLIFLPVIFYPILGFGSATYVGQNPMKDFIFKNDNQNNNMNTNQQYANPNNGFYQNQQYGQQPMGGYDNGQYNQSVNNSYQGQQFNQAFDNSQYGQSTPNMYSNNQNVQQTVNSDPNSMYTQTNNQFIPQTPNNAQPITNSVKYCINCGAELPNGSNHCSICGKDNI